MGTLWNKIVKYKMVVPIVCTLMIVSYAVFVDPTPTVAVEVPAIEQMLSEAGQRLEASPHVLKVCENGADILVWVDKDLDGSCDMAIVYVYLGKDFEGKRLYQMLHGDCEMADALYLEWLNKAEKRRDHMAI